MNSLAKNPLSAAAATWDDPNENIEATNARIHDGVPIDKLEDRADSYIQTIFGLFPYIQLPQQPTCLEIGSGTGYIMEALDRELTRQRKSPLWIGGLDIAKNMLAKAKARLGKKKLFKFFLYDGMSVPLPEESVDFIYSVAALQHVPKPYVYNPFFEMLRIVKQEGFVAIHLLSFKHLAVQEQFFPWREEIKQQITGVGIGTIFTRRKSWRWFSLLARACRMSTYTMMVVEFGFVFIRQNRRFRPILILNGILKSILMSLARMQPSTGRNMVIKRGEFGDEVYYGS